VLTKCDLVPRWLSEAWRIWLEETEGEGVSVVLMESYREEELGQNTQGSCNTSDPVLLAHN
jgi:ribosome biogenesis GTPase A